MFFTLFSRFMSKRDTISDRITYVSLHALFNPNFSSALSIIPDTNIFVKTEGVWTFMTWQQFNVPLVSLRKCLNFYWCEEYHSFFPKDNRSCPPSINPNYISNVLKYIWNIFWMKWKNVFVLPLLSNNTADREFFTIKYHTLLENMIPENKKKYFVYRTKTHIVPLLARLSSCCVAKYSIRFVLLP